MPKHKQRDTSFKRIIIILLVIIAITSTILIIKIKVSEHIDNKKQEEISQVLDTIEIPNEQITLEIPEKVLKVRQLQKENSEVVGWLEIEGTNIKYPVCQTDNNDYYLNHTYKKEENVNGSIFLDKDYDFNRPSENLLIYRTQK